MNFSINISGRPVLLDRVTIFLGINGAGKSSTLNGIKDFLMRDSKLHNVIFIEGGRGIRLTDRIDSQIGPSQITSLEHIQAGYKRKLGDRLTNRISDAFRLLIKKTKS